MNNKSYAALAALVVITSTANAETYTARDAFLATAGTVTTETFESAPLVGTVDSGPVSVINFADFSASSSPIATKVVNTDHYYGSFNTTPGGQNYLYFDTDVGLQGSTATFTFTNPISAIGFDYTGFNEPTSSYVVTIDGQSFTLAATASNDSSEFWGYVGTHSFTSFTLAAATDSGYSLDQVSYTSSVPESSTLTMMMAGMLFACFIAKRRPA